MSHVLDEWVKQNIDTWAPSSARDQQSRVKSLKKDQIARLPLARLTVADIERWHTRLRVAGMADAGIKNQRSWLRFSRRASIVLSSRAARTTVRTLASSQE